MRFEQVFRISPNIIAAFLCLTGASLAASSEIIDTIEQTFTVSGTPEIRVRNVDGRTVMTSHEGSEIRILATKEVSRARDDAEAKRAADKVEVRIEQVGSRIEVEARYPKVNFSWNGPRVEVHFEITAPPISNLDIKTVDGPLEVDGFEGTHRLKTVDGNLRAETCSGKMIAEATDGDMLLRGIRGAVEARTVDGNLDLMGTLNTVRVKSTDGDVTIRLERDSAMEEDWSIKTTDGSISLAIPEGFGADLDVRASDGDIEIEHPITMQGKLSRQRFQGQLSGGGHLMQVRSSDGSIKILKR